MSSPRLQAVNGDQWVGESDAPPTPPGPSTDSAAGGTTPPSAAGAGRPQKQRAERSLPTDRLSFDKQVEVLRAIAQMSGANKRPVTAEDLSAAIGLKGGTGGLSNKFFRDSGWVVSAGRGMYAATEPLIEYHRHLNVDPDDKDGARRRLVAPVMSSWYWEVLEPMLEGAARQTMILHALSKEAGAYEHTPQLLLIVTWLEWLGFIRRDGDLVLRGSAAGGGAEQVENEEPGESIATEDLDEDTSLPAASSVSDPAVTEEQEATACPIQAKETRPAAVDTSALISFSFNVRITAEDAAKLSGEQLQSLLEFAEKLRG